MSDTIPETHLYLLKLELRAHANLALVLKDGTPQVTPLWFDYVDGLFIINTARGRVKDKALHRTHYAALCINDPANPDYFLAVRGPVVVETEDGAWEQIDDLHHKYNGDGQFTRRPGQVRVTYKIKPEHVFGGT